MSDEVTTTGRMPDASATDGSRIRLLRGRRQRPKLRGWRAFLRDLVVIIVAAVVISFLIKTFLVRSFWIPSGSMEPTLVIDDRIIVNELVPDAVPLSHGDVVVFRDPGGWLDGVPKTEPANPVVGAVDWVLSIVGITAPDSEDHLIKRVIGLPGDTVACCTGAGQVTVNGVPLDEPYIQLPPGETLVSKDAFEVTVPEDAYWVMGDNRWNSQDSRYNRDKPGDGFVPRGDVVGRAFVVSWPVSRWAWLDNYPLVFADVGSGSSAGR